MVTCYLDDKTVEILDTLVEAGIRPTRSDTVTWLIGVGLEMNRALVERVYAPVNTAGTVSASLERLRFLSCEDVCMSMDEFPVLTLAAEQLGHAKVERNALGFSPWRDLCPLHPNPVADTVARGHLQDLQPTLVADIECRSIGLIACTNLVCALDNITTWTEKGRGIGLRAKLTKRFGIAIHKGSSGVFALLHESLKIAKVISAPCLLLVWCHPQPLGQSIAGIVLPKYSGTCIASYRSLTAITMPARSGGPHWCRLRSMVRHAPAYVRIVMKSLLTPPRTTRTDAVSPEPAQSPCSFYVQQFQVKHGCTSLRQPRYSMVRRCRSPRICINCPHRWAGDDFGRRLWSNSASTSNERRRRRASSPSGANGRRGPPP